jgi:hypothetical protein
MGYAGGRKYLTYLSLRFDEPYPHYLGRCIYIQMTSSGIAVEWALHKIQCDDIIAKLSQGINTVIGAKSVYLSGGEQQRIANACVMLKMRLSSFWTRLPPFPPRKMRRWYKRLLNNSLKKKLFSKI